MNAAALLLLGGSAVLHASWNFLAKRAQDQVSFMFLMLATSPIIWLIPMLRMIHAGFSFGPWYLPVLGGVFQSLYIFTMGRGYACGDLSQVYPLARGLAPVLVALAAWPLMGEGLNVYGAVGIACVVGGTLVLNTENCADLTNGNALRGYLQPAARWALLSSVMIAGYHIVDKSGALHASSAFAYLCMMHVYLITFLGALTLTVRRPAEIRAEWQRNWQAVLVVMALCFIAYFMVVAAMKLSAVAYVAALRNLGILFGVILGATALRERSWSWRLAGAGLMVAGIAVIAVWG